MEARQDICGKFCRVAQRAGDGGEGTPKKGKAELAMDIHSSKGSQLTKGDFKTASFSEAGVVQ